MWTRDPETKLLPLQRELGIGFVPYSPLDYGLLTGDIGSPEQLSDDDWRKTNRASRARTSKNRLRRVRRCFDLERADAFLNLHRGPPSRTGSFAVGEK